MHTLYNTHKINANTNHTNTHRYAHTQTHTYTGTHTHTHTHRYTHNQTVPTFIQVGVPDQLVAGRTDAEAALRTHPVEVEEGGITRITHLPQSLHRSLPNGRH